MPLHPKALSPTLNIVDRFAEQHLLPILVKIKEFWQNIQPMLVQKSDLKL